MDHVETGLLNEIVENPADDVPRLVYADWLEIEGRQESRARFIREQIELERMDDCRHGIFFGGCRCCFLKRKTARIANDMGIYWSLDLRKMLFPDKTKYLIGLINGDARINWRFIRGFVGQIRMDMKEWKKHGKQIVGSHPIQKVVITGSLPARITSEDRFGWTFSGDEAREGDHAFSLPRYLGADELWDGLAGASWKGRRIEFSTSQEALAALSEVLIKWAKQKGE